MVINKKGWLVEPDKLKETGILIEKVLSSYSILEAAGNAVLKTAEKYSKTKIWKKNCRILWFIIKEI